MQTGGFHENHNENPTENQNENQSYMKSGGFYEIW